MRSHFEQSLLFFKGQLPSVADEHYHRGHEGYREGRREHREQLTPAEGDGAENRAEGGDVNREQHNQNRRKPRKNQLHVVQNIDCKEGTVLALALENVHQLGENEGREGGSPGGLDAFREAEHGGERHEHRKPKEQSTDNYCCGETAGKD